MNLSIRQVYSKGDYMKKIEDVLVKVMPQNVEAEEAVLGSVLIGGDVEMQIAMGWIQRRRCLLFRKMQKHIHMYERTIQ